MRRAGIWSVVAAGVALGVAPHFLLPGRDNLHWTAPWFIALFTMGCASAVLSTSQDLRYAKLRHSSLWPLLAIGVVVMMALYTIARHHVIAVLPRQMMIGAVSATLILLLANHAEAHNSRGILGPILRALESRPAMALGTFSYSLYLIHVPIESKLIYILSQHFNEPATTALAYLVALPLALAGAYCFYLLIERPTIKYRARLHSRAQRQVEEVRATNTA